MACQFSSCGFFIFLSILGAIAVYIMFYIIIYIYIAYITYEYNSIDLNQWKEDQLLQIQQKYDNMPLETTPVVNIAPPS
jgi:hypothetical protein